jgi:hypothetical protein
VSSSRPRSARRSPSRTRSRPFGPKRPWLCGAGASAVLAEIKLLLHPRIFSHIMDLASIVGIVTHGQVDRGVPERADSGRPAAAGGAPGLVTAGHRHASKSRQFASRTFIVAGCCRGWRDAPRWSPGRSATQSSTSCTWTGSSDPHRSASTIISSARGEEVEDSMHRTRADSSALATPGCAAAEAGIRHRQWS